MTALKPLENRRVRGVASDRYPGNELCSHPECAEQTDDFHHCFPRSAIGNDSWFVEIDYTGIGDSETIPHVTGLCRKHHEQVELHQAWIKLLDGGVFTWYDRVENSTDGWLKIGPLDPQPGGREKARKPRKKFQGEQRRQRRVISFAVPADEAEDGAGLFEDLVEQARAVLGEGGQPDGRPLYYVLLAALYVFVRDGG